MNVEDPRLILRNAQMELDRCTAFIRVLGLRLETALNLQYLSELESPSSAQAEAFRSMLAEQLALMSQLFVEFYKDRERSRANSGGSPTVAD